jgi:hypothetical protein
MLAAPTTKAAGCSFTPMTSISGSYALNNFEEVLDTYPCLMQELNAPYQSL